MLIGGQDPRDNHVLFLEEGHKYLIDGISASCSVTKLVEHYFPKFEGQAMAKKMLSNPRIFEDPEKREKYYGIVGNLDLQDSKDLQEGIRLVTEKWSRDGKAASDKGTEMHKAIEDYYRELTPLPQEKEYTMFKNFDEYTRVKGYLPFRSEQIVWDKSLDLAGSSDMLYIKEKNKDKKRPHVWLVDWKRSKEIVTKNKFRQKGIGPMKNRDHCNYQHYSLQLNIYKYLMEKHYNIKIKKMSLIILHPDQEDWEEYIVDHMYEIDEVVKDRLKEVERIKTITLETINRDVGSSSSSELDEPKRKKTNRKKFDD